MIEDPREDREDAIDRAFAAYLRLVDAGTVPDLDSFLAAHSTISAELRELITTASVVKSMVSGDGTRGLAAELKPASLSETLRFNMADVVEETVSPPDTVQLFGEYELIEELGRGGMGVVYKARQNSMNRLVALKMIIGGRYSSEDSIRRFYQEAKAAGKLSHRNIVRAYAAGDHDGRHFFAMELIEGRTLRDLLKTRAERLPASTIARYMRAIAEAVQFAHGRGILHRDLKPSNIIIDNGDVPKIADFGLAKHLTLDEECSFESSSGSVIGTPSYMSPEQAASRGDQVGPASDVYSLGAILYELLTGQPPFKDESPVGTLLLVLNEDVIPPSDIDSRCHRGLEAVCLKCLEKHPTDRYDSCEELAADLDCFLRGEPVKARRLTSIQRAWFWLRGVPLVAYAIGRDPGRATKAQRRVQWATIMILALCLGTFLASSAITEHAYLRSIEIGVAEVSGEYDRIGNIIRETFPPGQIRVVNTAGSPDSRDRLLRFDVDLCILQYNTVSLSEDVAIVAPLYREAILIVVHRTSGIDEARDLAGRAIALGIPTSGFRATSDQMLEDLGISTDPAYQDYSWTDLSNDSLDGAIVTVAPRDSRLERLLASDQFRIVPFHIDELHRFRPYTFAPHELPAGAGIAPEGLAAATAEAVLAVRKSAPSWFVKQCLESIYLSKHNGLAEAILKLDDAAAWSEGKSLHPAARKFFKSRHDAGGAEK